MLQKGCIPSLAIPPEKVAACPSATVSYTHLDVYKRQTHVDTEALCERQPFEVIGHQRLVRTIGKAGSAEVHSCGELGKHCDHTQCRRSDKAGSAV